MPFPESDQPGSELFSRSSHHLRISRLFMTRITNFGRKRTHVEATFNYNEADSDDSNAESPPGGAVDESAASAVNFEGVYIAQDDRSSNGQPPKKKRKRGPRKKAGVKAETGTANDGEEEKEETVSGGGEKDSNTTSRGKSKKSASKVKARQGSSFTFNLHICFQNS